MSLNAYPISRPINRATPSRSSLASNVLRKIVIASRNGTWREVYGLSALYLMVRVLTFSLLFYVDRCLCISPGHAGHSTVDFVAATLPVMLTTSLQAALATSGSSTINTVVPKILSNSIQSVDNLITSQFLDIFPTTPLKTNMTDEVLHRLVDGNIHVLRASAGTTALITLTDPQKRNLWCANLGDCRAGTHATPRIAACSFLPLIRF